MMRLSTQGRAHLKRLEGFRAKAYIPVPGDRITIGYGFTDAVQMGDTITPAEADARLVEAVGCGQPRPLVRLAADPRLSGVADPAEKRPRDVQRGLRGNAGL